MNTLRYVGYLRSDFVSFLFRKNMKIKHFLPCTVEDFITRGISTDWSSSRRSTSSASISRVRQIYNENKSTKGPYQISFPTGTHRFLNGNRKYLTLILWQPGFNFQRHCNSSSSSPGSGSNDTSSNLLKTGSSNQQERVDHHHHESIVQQLKKLENSLRFHGYSTVRIGIAVFVIIGLMVYLLRDPIRENVAEEVSQVASRSLEHEHVVIKAEEFAKSLLQTLLHDDNMRKLAAQFVKQVLNSPEMKKAGLAYISNLLEDQQSRQIMASTIKQVLLLAIHDPETTAALKAVVVLILSDPESQRAARGLITAVFRHEELKAAAAVFFADVLMSQAVLTQATQLGKDVTMSVITDPRLKEETGKSFWQALKYSVTPRWFSGNSTESEPSPPTSEISDSSKTSSSSPPSSSEESVPASSPSPSSSQPPPPTPASSSSSSSTSIPPASPSSPPLSSSPSLSSSSSLPSSPSSSSSSPSLLPPPPPSSSEPLSMIQTPLKPQEIGTPPSAISEEATCEEQILDEDANILT